MPKALSIKVPYKEPWNDLGAPKWQLLKRQQPQWDRSQTVQIKANYCPGQHRYGFLSIRVCWHQMVLRQFQTTTC